MSNLKDKTVFITGATRGIGREIVLRFFIDEEVLRGQGVTDFEQYALTPGVKLYPDIFLD